VHFGKTFLAYSTKNSQVDIGGVLDINMMLGRERKKSSRQRTQAVEKLT